MHECRQSAKQPPENFFPVVVSAAATIEATSRAYVLDAVEGKGFRTYSVRVWSECKAQQTDAPTNSLGLLLASQRFRRMMTTNHPRQLQVCCEQAGAFDCEARSVFNFAIESTN